MYHHLKTSIYQHELKSFCKEETYKQCTKAVCTGFSYFYKLVLTVLKTSIVKNKP